MIIIIIVIIVIIILNKNNLITFKIVHFTYNFKFLKLFLKFYFFLKKCTFFIILNKK
jgi:hypothetical protein